MKHKRIYEALKAHGHSPSKAVEILVDARRKNRFALSWIRQIVKTFRTKRFA